MERKYFDICEKTARTAHNMMSMSDYKENSQTEGYRTACDLAYNLADLIAKEKPERAGEAYKIAVRYAKRMADNINANNRIGCMCPSVMISGAGNFPVRKKEKQVAAWDRNHKEYEKIQELIDKLERIRIGKEIIKSSDENVIDKLQEKLEELEATQNLMKSVNAYYRKHKTLEGCEDLTITQQEKLMEDMKSSFHYECKPFMSYSLSNNNQNIKSTKKRLEKLMKEKEKGTTEKANALFRAVENTEDMRLQLFFEEKPEVDVRNVLKSNGFRWSPRNNCWQRQLTDNARYALKKVEKEIL